MIQPNAQTDRDVAEAAGIRVCRDNGMWRRLDGSGKGPFFHPTTDMGHAMQALKLWLERHPNCIEQQLLMSRIRQILSPTEPAEEAVHWVLPRLCVQGPIAICEAILAVAKAKERE